MAVTSNSRSAPVAKPGLFQERLEAFLYARDRLEREPDGLRELESNHLADAYLYAENLVLGAPAADLADLRAKAEILWGDPAVDPDRSHVSAFLADLVRLTNHTPSRVFAADLWLARFEREGGMWVVRGDEVLILGPIGGGADVLIDLLTAMDGAEAVKALIRRRHDAGQAGLVEEAA